MERNIIIKDIATGAVVRLNGTYSTLEDVLVSLREKQVPTSGKEYIVAGANITLRDGSSQLPESVVFNGQTRTDLVIVSSNIEKKMTHGFGASRKELYITIQLNNLQDVVKEKFGKNYTQCKTEELQEVVNIFTADACVCNSKEEPVCHSRPASDIEVLSQKVSEVYECVEKILNKLETLPKSYANICTNDSVEDSQYSEEDLMNIVEGLSEY